jgi:hypothetical protein
MSAKVLIVVLAETRAHELTFPLFKQNLLDRLGADLALCIGDNARETRNPFYDAAKFIWQYKEPDDWTVAFDEYAEGRDWRVLLELRDQWLGGIKHPTLQHPGSAGILVFFREFLRRKFEETGALEAYDWLIITRSDFMWPMHHPGLELFSPEHVYVPDGERYNGFTDRHIMVPKRFFKSFLDVARDVFSDPVALANRMKALGRPNWNLESFIKFRFGELGLLRHVRFFPYLMYSLRPSTGTTRWTGGTYSNEHRYFIKYPTEYNNSRILQSLVVEDADWRHLMGPGRFRNWRMYFYAWMRAHTERPFMPKQYQFLRLLRRFWILMSQPLETGKLDRLR